MKWCIQCTKRKLFLTKTSILRGKKKFFSAWSQADAKNQFFGKEPDAEKDRRQEEKGMTEERTQWTWVWASSGSWWWIGRHGVPKSMGSQRVGHDWETELNWPEADDIIRPPKTEGNLPLADLWVVVYLLNHVLLTPWTVALQAPLSMGFLRQEYWNGLPFSSPADLY